MHHTEYAKMSGAGWKDRATAAAAKHAAATDPKTRAVARVRACIRYLGDARMIAEEEFAATHAPVPSPVPALVHADVAAILRGFLTRAGLEGVDLTRPINAYESVDMIQARHGTRLQEDLDEAQADLIRIEREEALERLRAAQDALASVEAAHARQATPTPVEVPHVEPAPLVASPDQVEAALAGQMPVTAPAPVEDFPVPADAPRRRGRPPGPRMVLDPDASDADIHAGR